MSSTEQLVTRASLFGRFADEWTRRDVAYRDFQVALEEPRHAPLYKEDGHFVFLDLEPATYTASVAARYYQARSVTGSVPSNAAVELARSGEDELYVTVKALVVTPSTPGSPPQNRVSFDPIAFLPAIAAGAVVLGSGGLNTTLSELLGGEHVDSALIDDVSGVSVGDTLRIVRSSRLLLRPGPTYLFPDPATRVSFGVTENSIDPEPVAGATLTIDRVNGMTLSNVVVDGLTLHEVTVITGSNGLAGGGKVGSASGIVELRSDGSQGNAPFLVSYDATSWTLTLAHGNGTTDTSTLVPTPIAPGSTETAAFTAFGIEVVLDERFDKSVDIIVEADLVDISSGSGAINPATIRITGCTGDLSRIDDTPLTLGNLGAASTISLAASGGFSGNFDGSGAGPKTVNLTDSAGNALRVEFSVSTVFDGTELSGTIGLRELENLIFTTAAAGPGAKRQILGPQAALETVADQRGEAVFYFAADTPITSLRVQATRPGYAGQTRTVIVTAGQRRRESIGLTPV